MYLREEIDFRHTGDEPVGDSADTRYLIGVICELISLLILVNKLPGYDGFFICRKREQARPSVFRHAGDKPCRMGLCVRDSVRYIRCLKPDLMQLPD